jgi:hypothetical protein
MLIGSGPAFADPGAVFSQSFLALYDGQKP